MKSFSEKGSSVNLVSTAGSLRFTLMAGLLVTALRAELDDATSGPANLCLRTDIDEDAAGPLLRAGENVMLLATCSISKLHLSW